MNRRGFLKTLAVAFFAGPALLVQERPRQVEQDYSSTLIYMQWADVYIDASGMMFLAVLVEKYFREPIDEGIVIAA